MNHARTQKRARSSPAIGALCLVVGLGISVLAAEPTPSEKDVAAVKTVQSTTTADQPQAPSIVIPDGVKQSSSTSLVGVQLKVRDGFGSGYATGSSADYKSGGIIGQLIGGKIGTGPVVYQGFWPGLGEPPSCCLGSRGNLVSDPGEFVDISDMQAMVDLLFFGGSGSPCPEENNVDGLEGIDITDLQFLVNYLFFGGSLPDCP